MAEPNAEPEAEFPHGEGKLHKRNAINIYLVSLLVSRMSIGVLVVPARITGLFSEAYLGSFLCKVCHYFALGSSASSVASTTAIAIIKYQEIVLKKSEIKISIKKALRDVGMIWLAGHLYAIRAPVMNDLTVYKGRIACTVTEPYRNVNEYLIFVDLVFLFITPMVIVVFCYVKLVLFLKEKKGDKPKNSSPPILVNEGKDKSDTASYLDVSMKKREGENGDDTNKTKETDRTNEDVKKTADSKEEDETKDAKEPNESQYAKDENETKGTKEANESQEAHEGDETKEAQQTIESEEDKEANNTNDTKKSKSQKKNAINMVMIVTTLFVICTIMPYIPRLYGYWKDEVIEDFAIFETICYQISYSNAWINAIVILLFRKDIRDAISAMCHCSMKITPMLPMTNQQILIRTD
ncbi:hypothetical protein LSH36_230g06026 [Paralvinella palmiformis]|uniref:G-protein coupled receptors family 1 profile domain-containing protein n=1 Tax=Paralvinella palmiformis TaxID=53620 RepID=A0AAD9JMJ7_9ANNE|nr:hypothetical protein LSH36_230g06026 [Paralvinella palmiformis]